MAEYLERKAAMTVPVLPKEYRTYPTANLDDAYEAGWNDALENLRNIPAAENVLPIVRCRDCRYHGCGVCSYLAAAVLPQWFCWNGERDGGADRESD